MLIGLSKYQVNRCLCKLFIALLCLFVVNLQCKSQTNDSNGDVKRFTFSLLTCSEGADVYTKYGHSAVRMQDSISNVDIVFNYGTFDFDTPFFVIKFLNGNLDYMLSVSDFRRFQRAYQREGREVVERRLILSTEESANLAELLMTNYQPQNRYYRYDFFFDNCATRIRDLIFKVKGIPADKFGDVDGPSFRDCLHKCVDENNWTGQGIDLVLGMQTEQATTAYQRAMLPYDLEALLDSAGVVDAPNVIIEKQYVAKEESLFERMLSPMAILLLFAMAVLALTAVEIRRGVWIKSLDIALAVFVSVLGVIFSYMWFVSDIKVTSDNLNALWGSLLYIPWCIAIAKAKSRNAGGVLRVLSIINVAAILAFFAVTAVGLQSITYVALSVSICMIVRNALIIKECLK